MNDLESPDLLNRSPTYWLILLNDPSYNANILCPKRPNIPPQRAVRHDIAYHVLHIAVATGGKFAEDSFRSYPPDGTGVTSKRPARHFQVQRTSLVRVRRRHLLVELDPQTRFRR
ncbi:MAG: hypothetical protein OEQ29_22815, partial [Alphaproteobacteria bacterium]|nr:hypothetical protein [Alphaproteobacteria bacterium]